MALVLALFHGTPITVEMVEATGSSVAVVRETRMPGMGGWIGCSPDRCEIEVVDLGYLRHEAAHVADMLADGVMDGSIAGWTPWIGTPYASLGPVEALGYWSGAQEVRP